MTKTEIEGMKVHSNYDISDSLFNSIFQMDESYLQFCKYNEFFNNTSPIVITASSIYVQEGATVNFTLNKMDEAIYVPFLDFTHYSKVIADCPIQYISNQGNLDKQFQRDDKLNYSVSFSNNDMIKVSNNDLLHCSWDSHSAFSTTRPALVNKDLQRTTIVMIHINTFVYVISTNQKIAITQILDHPTQVKI